MALAGGSGRPFERPTHVTVVRTARINERRIERPADC